MIETETRETNIDFFQGLSNKPIRLRVYSPHVLNLTLVDLPGLTKVAVGDQPEDIEYMIRDMIMTYIQPENTIILAVTPANQDLANSDALKLAKHVDKDGDRTIGVITKLDLMDKGTDAKAILENRLLPLKKGYIGVVNRSQRDIDNNIDIKKALAAEREWLIRESPYKSMVDRMGTKYLQTVLNKELTNHIKAKLPEIRSDILRKSREIEDELKNLGYEGKQSTDSSRRIHHLLTNFVDGVKFSIDGSGDDVQTKSIKGGVQINRCFYNEFEDFFDKSLSVAMNETIDKEIGLAVVNLNGVNNALFVPQKAFEAIVKMLLEQYEAPLASCVQQIREIMEDILKDSVKPFELYPRLRHEVLELVGKEIDKNEKRATEHLLLHINAQKSFLNTKHPYFKDPLGPSKKESQSTPTHSRNQSETKNLVSPDTQSSFYVLSDSQVRDLVNFVQTNKVIKLFHDVFKHNQPTNK